MATLSFEQKVFYQVTLCPTAAAKLKTLEFRPLDNVAVWLATAESLKPRLKEIKLV